MSHSELIACLWEHQDVTYRQMQTKILPNIPEDCIIGVRTPELRTMAKQLTDSDSFLNSLPHQYFEENQIHSFVIADFKDFQGTAAAVSVFLPFIDNWATCDQLTPKSFRKHHKELLPYIESWISSPYPYAVRFGIKMLMDHFLEDDFLPRYPEIVASVKSEEYYIRMMSAWYFATALAKQYDTVYPYFTEQKLEKWVHNKAIQKAVESYRVTAEHKEQLKKLRIK